MPEMWRRRSVSLGEPSQVLDGAVLAVFRTIIVFSLYLHFAGHNQPGGGFIAGLVAGAALTLRFITGHEVVRARLPLRNEIVLGAGVVLAAGTALVPLLLGNQLLEHHTWSHDVAVLGQVKWTSALYFDTGIYLIVLGVVGTFIEILGTEDGVDDTGAAAPTGGDT